MRKLHWTTITLTDGEHDFYGYEKPEEMRDFYMIGELPGMWACSAEELAQHPIEIIDSAGLGRDDIDWTGAPW